ncbi:ATP-binding protein [Streptomyces gardneri]|uniref:ATP-binding protein n=1 Tax=Nocardia TaxID=1817 RepID=UPI001357E6C5|nr:MULTISPECIES: ATP-binding protein [Nocardia]MBF6167169.1 ATP-binding protein [Streptomyces gardneri]MBF6204215.1 ATP-binding protein [Streptomyces gardneri]
MASPRQTHPDRGWYAPVSAGDRVPLPNAVTPLDMDFPAEAEQLATVRHTLQEWLAASGMAPGPAYDVLLAVGEACTNAVEHGHRGDGGVVRLRASIDGDELRVTISDSGRWKPPDPHAADSLRGRGMQLIRALIPDVSVTTGDSGTVVDLRARFTE